MKTESNTLKKDIQIKLRQGESFMNPASQAKEQRKGCDGSPGNRIQKIYCNAERRSCI